MNKRIIILILLLLNVFFYSCSSNKNTIVTKPKKIVLPEHSNYKNEDSKKDSHKDVKIDDLKKRHYERQTKAVQEEMKRNEQISMKNTPVRKKKSLFSKRNECSDQSDQVINDGVSDTRP